MLRPWDEAHNHRGLTRAKAAGGSGRLVAAAALLCLLAATSAHGQTDAADAYTASIEALCRSYATTQVGMPPDQMFAQCMSERHCRVAAGSSQYQCEAPGPLSWHGGGY